MEKTWRYNLRPTLKNPNFQSMDELEKVRSHVFHWEKWNFKLVMNSLHTAGVLALGKALNKISTTNVYPNRLYVK